MNKEEEKLEEGLYKGKKLKNMSRQELYEALYAHDQLYRGEIRDKWNNRRATELAGFIRN